MNPILEVTQNGVKAADREHQFDVLVLATGFYNHAGALLDLDLRGVGGETIQNHWRDGTTTYLGMTIDDFPNLFFAHGPQGPAPANAPTCVEVQGSWIVQTIEFLRCHGITKFTPTPHAASTYKKHINALFDVTLFPLVDGQEDSVNVPGKKREVNNYLGGLSAYKREITHEIESGYPGFQREALRMVQLQYLK